jgi:hypothetical protein
MTDMAQNSIFKLDFNFTLKDAEDFPLETIKSGIKAGTPVTLDMYEELKANRLLGRTIALSNEELGGTAFDWYPILLSGKILEASKIETGILKEFILNQRKEKNQNFSNVIVKQLLEVFKKAGYKD